MSKTILQGLIGAWCPTLGPSGYTLLDRSGRGQHGTLTNMDAGTDWVGTSGGWALDFDGVNDYVDARQTLTGAFTVSMWANRRTAGTFNERILWGNLTDVDTYIADILLSGVTVQSDTAGTAKTFSGFTFSNSVWFHLIVSRDAANGVRVWKDGIESTSGTQTISGTFTLQGIGRYANASGGVAAFQWDGQIGDVGVWNRALTPVDVRQLYQAGQLGLGRMLTPQRRSYAFRVPAAGNRRRRIICGAEC